MVALHFQHDSLSLKFVTLRNLANISATEVLPVVLSSDSDQAAIFLAVAGSVIPAPGVAQGDVFIINADNRVCMGDIIRLRFMIVVTSDEAALAFLVGRLAMAARVLGVNLTVTVGGLLMGCM